MNSPINQHYVPQGILRNFQIQNKKGKEKCIYVFDKSNCKEYQSPIRKIATERYFYEVNYKDQEISIENELEKYESTSIPIIQKIISNRSLKSITKKEKLALSKFICLQLTRVPATRNKFVNLADFFDKELNYFQSMGVSRPNEVDDKIIHFEFIMDTISKFTPLIYNKDWLLCESINENYFIGDNPVVLNNTFNKNQNGIGLKSLGVEIYMPISPNYCLLLICNSVRKSIKNMLNHPITNIKDEPAVDKLISFKQQLKRNETVVQSKENVIFANFLQYSYAERFIYSHKLDFSLPKEILSKNGYKKNSIQFY
ncbi:DUF4238 domain-containing protein [Acinetobacter bereziniae]|uniref:DUF4238 domain-containing protein n=1 Tax=Acinetobacter bereziniae TaxID=106648 RepID=UPI000CA33ADE|nr:DUF4238 domain-containing protein [Acinetobacter bereziniae]ATZ62972.1 hypothetical protein BSR55_06300 [Acinetobacter bereziniae]